MRRLGQRLFTLCSAVSLLLCVALCMLWARSYARWDTISRRDTWPVSASPQWYTRASSFRIGDGSVDLHVHGQLLRDRVHDESELRGEWSVRSREPHAFTVELPSGPSWGFDRREVPARPGHVGIVLRADVTVARMPMWAPAVAAAVLPAGLFAFRLRRWLSQRNELRPGRCRHCGYDLRATPGRCPECGTPVSPP
jgi:hypothetical protein